MSDATECGTKSPAGGEHVCNLPAGHRGAHQQREASDLWGTVPVAIWGHGPQMTPEPVIGPKRVCNVCGRAHKF